MAKKPPFCYIYNAHNRLVRSKGKSGKVVENAHNGDGLRVSKSVDGVTTRYLYEQDRVVLEQDGNGNQTAMTTPSKDG